MIVVRKERREGERKEWVETKRRRGWVGCDGKLVVCLVLCNGGPDPVELVPFQNLPARVFPFKVSAVYIMVETSTCDTLGLFWGCRSPP